jgi:hypothetical protein
MAPMWTWNKRQMKGGQERFGYSQRGVGTLVLIARKPNPTFFLFPKFCLDNLQHTLAVNPTFNTKKKKKKKKKKTQRATVLEVDTT